MRGVGGCSKKGRFAPGGKAKTDLLEQKRRHWGEKRGERGCKRGLHVYKELTLRGQMDGKITGP